MKFTPEEIARLRELANEFVWRYANGRGVYNHALSLANILPAALDEIERLNEIITSFTSVCGVCEDEISEALDTIVKLFETEEKYRVLKGGK